MIRKHSSLLLALHQTIDLLIVSICLYLAYKTKINLPGKFGSLTSAFDYRTLHLLALITFHVSLRLFGSYQPYRMLIPKELFCRILKGTLTGTAGIIFLAYMMHLQSVSRLLVALFCGYSFLGLTLFKLTLYKLLTHTRYNNYNTRSILVIGSKFRSLDFVKAVWRRRESGYRVLGCLENSNLPELVGDRVYNSVKVIGTMKNFKELLQTETIDEVVFGIPLKMIENVHEYIYYAEEMGKNVRVLPDFQLHNIKYYPQTAKVDIQDFLGITTLVLSSSPQYSTELMLKSVIDYTGALIGIILLSPVVFCICLAIKCSSRGPLFFSQERSGLNGRRFKLHKFRTMVVNAESLQKDLLAANEMDGPVFKMKKDPRVTKVGAFLRKTSLDELPQLFNVLKGQMSLVGPRPPIPKEVESYELWQRRRLSMKPGLTCIWQVSGRNNTSFEQWMSMDLEYIDNWSLKLDLKLLLLTVREVIFGRGR